MTAEQIAVAHWGEYVNGGGERVAWDLQQALDAPLYVSHRDESIEPANADVEELDVNWLWKRMLDAGDPWRMAAHQVIWQAPPELLDADVVVTSGNETLAYVPRDDQTWIAYTHHTSRLATDLYGQRLQEIGGRLAPLRRLKQTAFRWTERQIYGRYAQKPDLTVANSELVAQRIQRYWGVHEDNIRVIYPPVDTTGIVRDGGAYYATLSRLWPEKRVVDIAKAFADTDYPLKIAGAGPCADDIKAIAQANTNIAYCGYVPEAQKGEFLADAKAFVFAAEGEDFGIAPAEAMAHGTPVIGVKDGFTQHQIIDGKNGITYERGHLEAALHDYETAGVAWSGADIHEFATMNFGRERFEAQIRNAITDAKANTDIDPEFAKPDPNTDSNTLTRDSIDVGVVTDGGDSA
jgi:glycosyltransferase involved in cell wall biosynthesis